MCKKITHSPLGDEEIFRLTKNSGLTLKEGIAHGEEFLAKMNLAFMYSGSLAMPTQAPVDRLTNKRSRDLSHEATST